MENMKTKENVSTVEVQNNIIIHYMIGFKQLCAVTVSFPLLALIICFITAYIFQPDDIHETHCRVYNVVPSISAITGISPQRYLWRICVAFHIGPRLIIAVVNKAYHLTLINPNASVTVQTECRRLLNIAFWLLVIEIGSLCGCTYISNRENYPVHEKLFILFMISSLTHMLIYLKAIKKVAETRNDVTTIHKGFAIKQRLFIISIISTIGLVGFFLQHRFLCHRMAFSWFAICEYIVAVTNMAFHITVILDFPTEHLVVAKGLESFKHTARNKID